MGQQARRQLRLQRQPVQSTEVASCSYEKAVRLGAIVCQKIRRSDDAQLSLTSVMSTTKA